MLKEIHGFQAVVGLLMSFPLVAACQSAPQSAFSDEGLATRRWASLPTDRNLQAESGLPLDDAFSSDLATASPPLDLKSLIRPRVELSAEWEPAVEGLAIGSYDMSVQVPVYPIFGPPPPFITGGYSFTQIDAPAALDLPAGLHEFSLGLAWMRRINERWMARFMLSGAFASDLDNTGSDAWQIRGGGFGIYRPNDQWSFAVGALATGRDDIPVLPAVGAIWTPSPQLRFNLMMPNPRVSLLLADTGTRQHWGYLGGGISGGTWAYDRASGLGDRLTYREWRLVLGWESTPPLSPGAFRPVGTRINAEVGYVLGREFQFDGAAPDIAVDGALLLRGGISF